MAGLRDQTTSPIGFLGLKLDAEKKMALLIAVWISIYLLGIELLLEAAYHKACTYAVRLLSTRQGYKC